MIKKMLSSWHVNDAKYVNTQKKVSAKSDHMFSYGKHMEINPSLPYKCTNCCEVFENKSYLDSHMVKQHETKQLFNCEN